MPRTYQHLTGYDREVIAQMKKKGSIPSEIARAIARDPSTINREVARNSSPGGYYSGKANHKAQARLRIPRRPRKIGGEMAATVKGGLKQDWSPDQIVGRNLLMGLEMPCPMTIYRYLATPKGAQYLHHLRGAGKIRRRNKKVHKRIHNRVMIDKRPKEVDAKEESGHWEGDTIRGPIKTPHCVMTMVERTSQYLVARKLSDRSAFELNKHAVGPLRQYGMKTLTVDNGMEFASHEKLAKQTGTSIYFAHSGCPWERGLNEQLNGLLRQYLPKGTDLSLMSPAQLRQIVKQLNDRPRKKLQYRTPNEVFAAMNFALVN